MGTVSIIVLSTSWHFIFFSQVPSPHPLLLYLCITGAQGKEPAQGGEVWAEGEEGEEMHIELLCLKNKGFSSSKNKFPILCLTSTYPHQGEDKINHLAPWCRLNSLAPHSMRYPTTSALSSTLHHPLRNLGTEESHLQVYMKLNFPFLFQENLFPPNLISHPSMEVFVLIKWLLYFRVQVGGIWGRSPGGCVPF